MDKEVITFVVTYRNNVKIVRSSTQDVKDVVKIKFETCPAFPWGFIIQYDHKEYYIMVDLDEPDQLLDRRSNKLLIASDESGEDADKSGNTKVSSESESSQEVSLFIKWLFVTIIFSFLFRNQIILKITPYLFIWE